MPKENMHLSMVREIRAVADDDSDEGIIEGYVAVWDTIDSFNTRFQRGCFKKTIENRMNKIKVLWNHDTGQPIGKLKEIREDDHGLFIRASLIKGVAKADETLQLIKGGAVDCLSFGFKKIHQKFERGIEVITEVMLGEISPVVFEANHAAKITSVRSEDFSETDSIRELRERGHRLLSSLEVTLQDIWWAEDYDVTEIVGLVKKATSDFSMAYTEWAQEVIDIRTGGTRMDVNFGNELTNSFRSYCKENDTTIEKVAQSSCFTIEELRSLESGKVIADYNRITTLSEDLQTAHDSVRSKAVLTLCDELRAGINTAEATRIEALLQKSLHNEADDTIAYLRDLRNKLIGDK